MLVRIYHNVTRDSEGRNLGYFGYDPDSHKITLVYAYRAEDGCDALALCEAAFQLFNVGDDPAFGTPHPDAIEYRRRGNRSLSVGDVVAITDVDSKTTWYHCASMGWTITGLQPAIVDESYHGTSSLASDY